MADDLTPAQQEVIDRLGRGAGGEEEYPGELRASLREELQEGLEPIARRVDQLFLSKHTIATALGCEQRYLADEDERFEWDVPKARGTVAHHAIRLGAAMVGEHSPERRVDEAIGALMGERGIGDWLTTCGEATLADLRTEAITKVAAFDELWPRLSDRWDPVWEPRIQAAFHDNRIVLSGKPDLTLGRAKSRVARKVIVDLKTGRHSPDHRSDLRFYALVETLRVGVPPRILATSYLESGELHTEVVNEDVLWGQVRRVIDAAGRIATLRAGERDPERHAGPPCWFCPLNTSCEPGLDWLSERRDA